MKKLKELFKKLKKRANRYWYLGPFVFILIAIAAMAFTVNPDNDEPVKKKNKKSILEEKMDKNGPDIDVKVNREYDDDGNLVRYDSSYSYQYSSIGTDYDSYLMIENVRKRFLEMNRIQNERIKQFMDYDPFNSFDRHSLMDSFNHDPSKTYNDEEKSRLKDQTKSALERSVKKANLKNNISDNRSKVKEFSL